MPDPNPTQSVEIAEPHGSRPEDFCPVCKSLDVTFPVGVTWTKCRTCRASWDAALRVLCHVIGCVEHVDGMHVDRAGDAIVHVGCAVCSALPHHLNPPNSPCGPGYRIGDEGCLHTPPAGGAS